MESWPRRHRITVEEYYRLADGVIYLLLIYTKNVRDNIDVKMLDKVRRAVHGEDD
jgi:hypothetical protein